MNVAPRYWIVMFIAMPLFLQPAIGHTDKPSPEANSFPDHLSDAALETYVNYRNALSADEKGWVPSEMEEIPSKFWTPSIKALKPIKVYAHRVNIVVVQRIHDGIEEGKYIILTISSFRMFSGVDGFELTPDPLQENKYTTHKVLDFKRARGK